MAPTWSRLTGTPIIQAHTGAHVHTRTSPEEDSSNYRPAPLKWLASLACFHLSHQMKDADWETKQKEKKKNSTEGGREKKSMRTSDRQMCGTGWTMVCRRASNKRSTDLFQFETLAVATAAGALRAADTRLNLHTLPIMQPLHSYWMVSIIIDH